MVYTLTLHIFVVNFTLVILIDKHSNQLYKPVKHVIYRVFLCYRKPQKGVLYLVYHEVIKDDPFEVAKFMKDHYGLSKEKIGEFVGEIRYDFNMAVLE